MSTSEFLNCHANNLSTSFENFQKAIKNKYNKVYLFPKHLFYKYRCSVSPTLLQKFFFRAYESKNNISINGMNRRN